MRIWVLLPAFNEVAVLEILADKIRSVMEQAGFDYVIVVVNDGSTDGSAEVLAELATRLPLETIEHRYNRGLGETIRDGIEYVVERGRPEDVLVRMDCDDTHDPKYIVPLVEKIAQGYEVVTCSRYTPGGGQHGVNLYRRTISRCANILIKLFFPIRGVKEYTCGYRAYRVSFLRDALEIFGNHFIHLKGMGFTGTVEKIVKAKMMGAAVAEIPFMLRYDKKVGPSKVLTNLTTLGYLMVIAKYVVWWGDLGRQWKAEVAARQERMRTARVQAVQAVPGRVASPAAEPMTQAPERSPD